MHITPGIYRIHKVDRNNQAFGIYDNGGGHGCYDVPRSRSYLWQQWYLMPVHGTQGYTIQSVQTKMFVQRNGDELRGASVDDATIWCLDHKYDSTYTLSVFGTNFRLCLTSTARDSIINVGVTESTTTDGKTYLWTLETMSDGTSETLNLSPTVSGPASGRTASDHSAASIALSEDRPSTASNHYDDEHFYTDMLFNMPRTPLICKQRIAALDWARQLGATNVPTMASFKEYERSLEEEIKFNDTPKLSQAPNHSGQNTIIPKDSSSPYKNDPHFYTDMLFNMPRTPFTRTQRAAALHWARKLGAVNVPTMESFDECEQNLEAVGQ